VIIGVNILQTPRVRWVPDELAMWLNEAATSTAMLRPDATARVVTVSLTVGLLQAGRPAGAHGPEDIVFAPDPNVARVQRGVIHRPAARPWTRSFPAGARSGHPTS
jgi:hypothetical protein